MNPLAAHLPNPRDLPLPWVVAEAGQTMAGDVEAACQLARECAAAGAWAMKIQMLRPETIATPDAPPYWHTTRYDTNQRDAFARAGLIPYDGWHKVVAACEEEGLVWFPTPFDTDAVAVAEREYVPACWKIASGDITNVPLLRAVNDTRRPVMVSTGGADAREIDTALRELSSCRVILLACTLAYPTMAAEAQLGRIGLLSRRFDYRDQVLGVGYSDHTIAHWSAPLATAAGALVLEKHTRPTIARGEVADNDMALDPAELTVYVSEATVARWATVADLGCSPPERAATRGARRSIYAGPDGLHAGQEIRPEDVAVLRPCLGGDVLDAADWDTVLDSDAAADIEPGAPLRYGDLRHRGRLFP